MKNTLYLCISKVGIYEQTANLVLVTKEMKLQNKIPDLIKKQIELFSVFNIDVNDNFIL